jgi:hypothetical protein
VSGGRERGRREEGGGRTGVDALDGALHEDVCGRWIADGKDDDVDAGLLDRDVQSGVLAREVRLGDRGGQERGAARLVEGSGVRAAERESLLEGVGDGGRDYECVELFRAAAARDERKPWRAKRGRGRVTHAPLSILSFVQHISGAPHSVSQPFP